MKAGKLDRRVVILRKAGGRDGLNNPVDQWTSLATVSASKEDVRDGEKFAAGGLGAELSARFQIRWSDLAATVDAKDRLSYRAKIYDIVGVKEIGRREGLEITAIARAD